jgi:hypothetical protein
MKYNTEDNLSFTMDLKDDNGDIWASVMIIPLKEAGKRDILLMDVQTGPYSARSITELLNLLEKRMVPFEDRRMVLEFLADRLHFLELNGI